MTTMDDLLLLLRLRTGAHEDEDRVFINIIILFKVILRHNILWSILCGIFREGEEDLGQEELIYYHECHRIDIVHDDGNTCKD